MSRSKAIHAMDIESGESIRFASESAFMRKFDISPNRLYHVIFKGVPVVLRTRTGESRHMKISYADSGIRVERLRVVEDGTFDRCRYRPVHAAGGADVDG